MMDDPMSVEDDLRRCRRERKALREECERLRAETEKATAWREAFCEELLTLARVIERGDPAPVPGQLRRYVAAMQAAWEQEQP